MIVGAGVFASSVRCLATVNPSMSGMFASSSTSSNGSPRTPASRKAVSAAAPLSTSVGRIFHFSSIFSKMRRFVALSSTTSTAMP